MTTHAGGAIPRLRLFERLDAALSGRVTVLSAPPGSGKTVLLRSWAERPAGGVPVAWVSLERGQPDAQRFWMAVVGELERALGEESPVQSLIPKPGFDGELVVERLLSNLAQLDRRAVLVIDDLHDLTSSDAVDQLQRFLAGLPETVHVVLSTRRDPRLGLHRLRLAGQLTELRAADLEFTVDDTRELLEASAILLPASSVELIQERTEGWAAGVRMAALSLAGHSDPERFVADFSGSERGVADYLLAEVLDRQPDNVRRLLLRTSVLTQVNAELAELLTEEPGAQAVLLALAESNAFVVPVDARRDWFRYHRLFGDLLRLELRRFEPTAVLELHRRASEWLAAHDEPVEAIRHALAAGDWPRAAELLADSSVTLALDGAGGTVHALLAGFPEDAVAQSPELAAVAAADQIASGSLELAAGCLKFAERGADLVAGARRARFELTLAVARMSLARRRGDLTSVASEVEPLLARSPALSVRDAALNEDLRALALLNLGVIESWTGRPAPHLEEGRELARRIGRPYVEIACLAREALVASHQSFLLSRKIAEEAVALAEAHGWGSDPVVAPALVALGAALAMTGHVDDAESMLARAERTLRDDVDPASALLWHAVRGMVAMSRERFDEALAGYAAAERSQALLAADHVLESQVHSGLLTVRLALGQLAAVRDELASMPDERRDAGVMREVLARVRLAEGDPAAAIDALAPVLDGTAPFHNRVVLIRALMLDAVARDALNETSAVRADVERALEVAEDDGLVMPFALTSGRELLERHGQWGTDHGVLRREILDALGGVAPPDRRGEMLSLEPLSDAEVRVLRYLPSNLSAQDIGAELSISAHTVKTHMRHIYAKLDAHTRSEAVARARAAGLLRVGRTGQRDS